VALDLFNRRSKEDRERHGDRLPPGQKLTDGWPVLHYGGIPDIDLATWRFSIVGMVAEELHFTWEEFLALPQETLRSEIHCVTHWSKFDNDWTGVKFTELMKRVTPRPDAKHVMVHSFGGYTTNVSRDELTDDDVILAHRHNGQPLTGRCASWCQSCTSGRAPSGCAASSSWMRRRRASGRTTATTSTATRGRKSATRRRILRCRR